MNLSEGRILTSSCGASATYARRLLSFERNETRRARRARPFRNSVTYPGLL